MDSEILPTFLELSSVVKDMAATNVELWWQTTLQWIFIISLIIIKRDK